MIPKNRSLIPLENPKKVKGKIVVTEIGEDNNFLIIISLFLLAVFLLFLILYLYFI